MSQLNYSKDFVSDVIRHFENLDNLKLRKFREHQIELENYYWTIILSSFNKLPVGDIARVNMFVNYWEKSFMHAFIRLNETVKSFKKYFHKLVRSAWENNIVELDEYFVNLHSNKSQKLENLIHIIVGAVDDMNKMYPLAEPITFPIDKYDKYEKKLNQPLSVILCAEIFKAHQSVKEDKKIISVYHAVDRKLVRILHKEMLDIARHNFCFSTYQSVFVPFREDDNLPFYKMKMNR